MQETNRIDLAKPTETKVLNIADVLRQKLLQYRLENYRSLRLPKVEGDERLRSRTLDLYQALALPIGNNAEYCKYLVRLFEMQQEINREPLSPGLTAVLRVLYEYIHVNPEDGKCAQKELTVLINLNLECQQESVRMNAHEVGRALTSLGLTDRKRTNVGFVVWLDLRTRKRLHQLAHDHGIEQERQFLAEGFVNNCALCKSSASNPAPAETKEDSAIDPKQP
jgi:hypothetical protein